MYLRAISTPELRDLSASERKRVYRAAVRSQLKFIAPAYGVAVWIALTLLNRLWWEHNSLGRLADGLVEASVVAVAIILCQPFVLWLARRAINSGRELDPEPPPPVFQRHVAGKEEQKRP